MPDIQRTLKSSTFLGVEAIMFDFDGPLCNVFARISPSSIAYRIQKALGLRTSIDDPLDLLEHLAGGDQQLLTKVEDAVVADEVEAVTDAPDTPGGVECITACLEAGLKIGIVSNNSAACVSVFLQRNELSESVTTIVGRAYAQPQKMKPNPWPLQRALAELAVDPAGAIMIGDSVSDIQAAQSIGVRVVALANKPQKTPRFAPFRVPIIEDMWELRRFLDLDLAKGD